MYILTVQHMRTGIMKGASVPNRKVPAFTKTMLPVVSVLAVVTSGSDPHSSSPAAGAVGSAAVVPSPAEELVLPLPAGKSLLSPPEHPQSSPTASSSPFLPPSRIDRHTSKQCEE